MLSTTRRYLPCSRTSGGALSNRLFEKNTPGRIVGLSFSDPDPKVRETAIERIISHIPLAQKTNAVIIIGLVRGIAPTTISEQRAAAWMVEALKECTQKALEADVRIALEPINRYETSLINSAAEGLELLNEVGAENLGLLLDTFHMNIEEPSIEESIKRCDDRIFHFHVADSNRWYPGAGHIDFRRIIETLDQIGYQDFLSAEILPEPNPDTAASETIAFLRHWIT